MISISICYKNGNASNKECLSDLPMNMPLTKRIVLQAPGFLGDEVVFTGAVRELQKETGCSFVVKTGNPDLWAQHNYIEGVNLSASGAKVVPHHHCPPFRNMKQVPVHFLEQYVRNLRHALGLAGEYKISKFAGEVPVSPEEAAGPPLGLNTGKMPGIMWHLIN